MSVVVKIDVRDTRVVFPDHVELAPDAKYEWEVISKELATPYDVKTSYIEPTPVPFGEPGPGSSTILFDNQFTVEYLVETGRDPRSRMGYKMEQISENNYIYTFTFTEEDYRNAKNNAKI